MKAVIPLLLLCSFLCTCATTNSHNQRRAQFKVTMDSKIGVLTYDDCLSRLGSPTTVTEGQDIFVATWRQEESEPTKVVWLFDRPFIKGPTSYGANLILTFDKSTQLLTAWSFLEF